MQSRERYHIEHEINVINKCHPTRTDKQYKETNKESIIRERKKDYYALMNKNKVMNDRKKYDEANKDKVNLKQNTKFVCECGGKYTRANKT